MCENVPSAVHDYDAPDVGLSILCVYLLTAQIHTYRECAVNLGSDEAKPVTDAT